RPGRGAQGRAGAPVWQGGPAGVRRSGSSSVDLLGAWGSGHGRTTAGPGVELILQDDPRGFTIDARPVGIALCLPGLAARATALHRPEVGLGEMAAEPFVAHGQRK